MKKTLKKKVGEGSWSIKGGFEPPLPIGSPVHFEQSNLMVFQKRGEIMKKVPKTKAVGSFKILKETHEKFVRMDVVMDDTLMDFLLKYADENIDKQSEREYRLSWAFADIIEKQLKFRASSTPSGEQKWKIVSKVLKLKHGSYPEC